jgi:transporter family protein
MIKKFLMFPVNDIKFTPGTGGNMKAVMFAALTAVCWSVGGYFEKKGLKLGGLSPLTGITVRTATALLVLGLAAAPGLGTLASAGTAPLLYLVLGGGVLAGSLGMLSFYTALGAGELSRVIPVAFGLTPLLGFALGTLFMKEPATAYKLAGAFLTSLGVLLLTAGK